MTIEKSGDEFRLLYDVKGRFYLQRLEEGAEERNFKLCRVNKNSTTANKVPYIVTHDGRTIRYPDPLIKVSKVKPALIGGSIDSPFRTPVTPTNPNPK